MFSIILPTYNRSAILRWALDHIFSLQQIEGCELIVIDDGSSDDTPQVLEDFSRKHANMQFVRQKNAGPGVARNTGLNLASRDYVLFLDDDVFPEPGLLQAHMKFLEQGMDVSQGMLEWTPELAENWVVQFMDRHGMQFCFDQVTDDFNLSFLYVYTANLALPRNAALEVGGFDTAFAAKRYAFEDTAFAYLLKKSGRKIGLNRAARALHHHPMQPEDLVRREYKVGYALGILKEFSPEIYRELNLAEDTLGRRIVTKVVRTVLRSPLSDLFGKEWQLRLSCREAFDRGRWDYAHQQE